MTPGTPVDATTQAGTVVSGRGRVALAVAAAVDEVAGVRRTGGIGVEVATQYAGGRVVGVGLSDAGVVVHVIAERLPLEPVISAVQDAARQALQSLSDPRAVNVVVDDLDVKHLPRRRK